MKLKKYASMIGAIILAATNMGYIFADDTESDENQPPNEINITEVKTIEGAEIENDEYDRALNSYLHDKYSDKADLEIADIKNKMIEYIEDVKVGYAKIHDSGNTGASFSFKMIGNNRLSYAKSGSGKVYLHRQNVNLSQVGVGVKYGHSTISISPSVSFPLGGGISFSKNVQNIGPNPLICYK